MERDYKYKSKCCGKWTVYVGNSLYVCPCCGLVYKEVRSWWDKYNTILVDLVELDEYIPSDIEIINGYIEMELNKEMQTELWKKLNRSSVVGILKNKGYRYKYINKDGESWSNLYIYKRAS